MASSYEGDVRLVEKLNIKIDAAKNLSPKSSSHTGRDTFVTVTLDCEEIFRTAIKEKDNSPLYGEKLEFDIPRLFRHLTFNLYDHDKFSKQHRLLGKFSIKKEKLGELSGVDNCFPLYAHGFSDDVQGIVHLELGLVEVLGTDVPFSVPVHNLIVKNIQCSNLALTNNACNPFVVLSLQIGEHRLEEKKTKQRMKTVRPIFDEIFQFTVPAKCFRNNTYSARLAPRASLGQFRPEDCVTSLDMLNFAHLHVSVYHMPTPLSKPVFLGKVQIPLRLFNLSKGHAAWYFLQPEIPGFLGSANGDDELVGRRDVGSLRVQISYSADHVFSSKVYVQLCSLLMESPSVKPVTASAAWILGELTALKREDIQPLVRVFLHEKQIIPLIRSLADVEIRQCTTDPTTIFRGNTLASTCLKEFMWMVGRTYLQSTLKSSLEKVLRERKPCEIDPGKIPDSESPKAETLKENLQNLVEIVEETLNCIVYSAPRCPLLMCQMFAVLRQLAEEHFPSRPDVKYTVLSSFVFLRFFAHAIVDPKMFELEPESGGDSVTTRTLVLLSKTVQSLGNHASQTAPPLPRKDDYELVSDGGCGGGGLVMGETHILDSQELKSVHPMKKEDYMSPVMKRFASKPWLDSIRAWLDDISTFPRQRDRFDEPPMLLREGWMMKKSYGKGKMFRPRKSFTKRYFTLTTTELRYGRNKDSKTANKIPASHILGVQRVEDGETSSSGSACMSNVLRINQPDNRSLIIQAKNCVEQKQWMEVLNRVRLANANRLEKCHPGAFRDGKWECCASYCEQNRGCAPVSTSDVRLNIDIERDMECIYALYLGKLVEMRGILNRLDDTTADSGMCGSGEAIYCNTDAYGVRWYEAPDINNGEEFTQALRNTLHQLCVCIEDLSRVHSDYLEEHKRRNRIGSLQCPIGEDNFSTKVSPAKQQQVLQPLPQSAGNVSIFKTSSSPG